MSDAINRWGGGGRQQLVAMMIQTNIFKFLENYYNHFISVRKFDWKIFRIVGIFNCTNRRRIEVVDQMRMGIVVVSSIHC